MSWIVLALSLAINQVSDFDVSNITSSQCVDGLLDSWGSSESEQIICKPYSLLIRSSITYDSLVLSPQYIPLQLFSSELFLGERSLANLQFVRQARCHTDSQVTAYIYDHDRVITADFKGLSSNPFEASSLSNHTKSFNSCNELSDYLLSVSRLKQKKFKKPTQKPWSEKSSVALVASKKNCDLAKDLFDQLLFTYHDEGRAYSELICISDQVIKKNNPSLVRKEIWKNNFLADHLFLIGQDIPVFELISKDESAGGRLSSYRHGYSDLPYADQAHSFWGKAKSKKSWPEAFHEENNLYLFDSPTKFAFSMDDFLNKVLSEKSYKQEKSVSRWIEAEDFYEDFGRFVHRRINHKPYVAQNFVSAIGGEGVLFRINDLQDFNYAVERSELLLTQFPQASEKRLYSATDLEQSVFQLDPNTTFLDLNEHGHPSAMGNLHAADIKTIDALPAFINLGACFSGSWVLESEAKESLIARILNTQSPPLSVIAAQGLTYFRTLGQPDLMVKDIFLSNWQMGQSIGSRQVESFNNNFSYIVNDLPFYMKKKRADGLLQTFSMMSIFGDPTYEF